MMVKDRETRRIIERLTGRTYAEAEQQRAFQIARNMKAEGFDLHAIGRVTGLTFDEVLNA